MLLFFSRKLRRSCLTWWVHNLSGENGGTLLLVNIIVVFCLFCDSAKNVCHEFFEHFNVVHSDQSFLVEYQEIQDGSQKCIYYIHCKHVFLVQKTNGFL